MSGNSLGLAGVRCLDHHIPLVIGADFEALLYREKLPQMFFVVVFSLFGGRCSGGRQADDDGAAVCAVDSAWHILDRFMSW